MKIIYLHQYFATRQSITSTRSYEIAKKLVSKGHEVYVITTDTFLINEIPYKEEKGVKYFLIDGIEIRAKYNHYSNYMGTYQRVKSFLSFMNGAYEIGKKMRDVDILFSTSTPLTIAIPTLRLSKKLKVPYVFEVRDLWPEAPRQMGVIKSRLMFNLLKRLEKKTYTRADHIIGLSPGMVEGIAEYVTEGKITMIPNMSDIDLFQNIEFRDTEKERIVKKYNLEGKFILSHIGAMGEANGLDYLIDAATILKERGETNIVIAIGGDGKVKPKLEKLCQARNLNNVIFYGYIPRKDIPDVTSLSHLTMTSFKNLPILETNSPNKFFDSLAAGKPIVVNSAGWTKNIVEKNEIGFYVNPQIPSELSDLLVKLQYRRNELSLLEEKIKRIAKSDYNADSLSSEVEHILVNVSRRNKK